MSFHTLQISSSHHYSMMFRSVLVVEHEHRIHECIFMHTVFVTLHICLLPTTFSGWQLVPHPSLTGQWSRVFGRFDMPRCNGQDEYGNIQMKEAMRLPVLFGMLGFLKHAKAHFP